MPRDMPGLAGSGGKKVKGQKVPGPDLCHGSQRRPRVPLGLVDEVQHSGFGGVAWTVRGLSHLSHQKKPILFINAENAA